MPYIMATYKAIIRPFLATALNPTICCVFVKGQTDLIVDVVKAFQGIM